jgi:DNA-binding SARP family transcriptional activator
MTNKHSDIDTIDIDSELVGGGRLQIDEPQPFEGPQRPVPGSDDARRIAELEREVQELRRANERMKGYFAKELGLEVKPSPPAVAVGAINDWKSVETGTAAHRAPSAAGPWSAANAPEPSGVSAPKAEFRVLGPVEAVVSGRLADLGAPKQRALLALLVSRVGQPVAVDVIVEELWTGNPPPSAITSLQAYVANLRRVLEPNRAPRTPATVLRTSGRGYLLDGRVVEVDVQRFGRLATAGWQALSQNEPHRALCEFETALGLWRGQAYPELADAMCVVPEVARLEVLRLSVIEGRCAALLDVGAHEVAVADLEAFTKAHPLREYGCELLSLALYRAGRQAEALAVLRSNQKRLAEDLGIDPRPALQRLERQILNQAPTLDWRPRPSVGGQVTGG